MDKFIKKELIGRVFRFHLSKPMVIIGVRMNPSQNYYRQKFNYRNYQVLVGRLYEGGCNVATGKRHYEVEVYSWYAYNRNDMQIEGRGTRKAISNCMKRQPDKIKWHTGKKIVIDENVRIHENNGTYWQEYKKSQCRDENEKHGLPKHSRNLSDEYYNWKKDPLGLKKD